MTIQDSIKSQYCAALEMFKQAVVKCPAALWDDAAYANRFGHIAYHALHFTHLYLQPTVNDFAAWGKPGKVEGGLEKNAPGQLYSREEILEYLEIVCEEVQKQVSVLDPNAASGFFWLPCDKLELQFYNIRHLQQHTGELCERLGAAGEIEVDWVLMGPKQ
jgi:hypothetical protein